MGDYEDGTLVLFESTLRYHPSVRMPLTQHHVYNMMHDVRKRIKNKQQSCSITCTHEQQPIFRFTNTLSHMYLSLVDMMLGTVLGGEFNWGGCLLKRNGGAQR